MAAHAPAASGDTAVTAGAPPAVLALVGLAGTGKSEATRLLADRYGYTVVYFGGVVIDEVRRRGLPVRPEHERAVREELRATEGMDAIAARSLPAIRTGLDAGRLVVIDGLYSAAELTRLRRELRHSLVLLAVHAPRWLRKERLAARPVRPLTGDELDQRDHFELTALDKALPIASADLHVINDGTLDKLGHDLIAALRAYAAHA